MLAPVREHAAEHTPSEPEATALAAHYAALADTLPYLGASSYDRDAALRARVELPNIEAVLPRRTADPEDSEAGWRWIRVGDTRQTLGSIGLAMTAYETARDCFAASATADPGHAQWQFDLGISNERIGDVLSAQGKLAEAAQAYQRKHEIVAKLAAADPGNAHGSATSPSAGTSSATCAWPRATCRRPPGLHRGQEHPLTSSPPPTPATPRGSATSPSAGNGSATCAGPRATCRAPSRPSPRARTSADKLATADPGNAQWQRDLSVSWESSPTVGRRSKTRPGAIAAWREALAVSERLARDFPDRSTCRPPQVVHLAGVARHLDHSATAAKSRRQGPRSTARLAVLRPLAEAGDWTPTARAGSRGSRAERAAARRAPRRCPDPPRHPRSVDRPGPIQPAAPDRSLRVLPSHLPALASLGLPARRGPWSTIPTISPKIANAGLTPHLTGRRCP